MITNYFSPLEFQVSVPRLPNVQFFTQSFQLPGLSSNPPETNNPFNRLTWTPEKLVYSPFSLSFIIDENLNNYEEVIKWIEGTTFPQEYEQFKNLNNSQEGLRSDISVVILNSHKNANIRFTYYDAFPIALSPINLDTTEPDVIYPKASVEFSYNYFKLDRVKDL